MTREKKTDWKKIMAEIHAWGVNDYELASLTGVSRSHLTNLRHGRRKGMDYDDGTAVMAIHRQLARQHAKTLRDDDDNQ